MSSVRSISSLAPATVEASLRAACARVAPVWPLERFVAVNPYHGLRDLPFEEAAARLATVAGAPSAMPPAYYAEALRDGRMSEDDIHVAARETGLEADSLFDTLASAGTARGVPSVPTVADALGARLGLDLARLHGERVCAWAAAHFDEGQALWRPPERKGEPFAAWLAEARIDRTPELFGVRGFRMRVASLPEAPLPAAIEALHVLGVPAAARELYLHRLLMRVGGWASLASWVAWEASLRGEQNDTPLALLAILLSWERALLESSEAAQSVWAEARPALLECAESRERDERASPLLALQRALEFGEERRLVRSFATPSGTAPSSAKAGARPPVQAAFCIDVRSEVLRRHFEAAGEDVETIGFAGFFGFPVSLRRLAHRSATPQCPVLLAPQHEVREGLADEARTTEAAAHRTRGADLGRAWKAFKMGAISCFSFVGPVGLAYLPKLLGDSLGHSRPVPEPSRAGLAPRAAAALRLDLEPIPLEERIALAEGALRGMSLTEDFAPIVMLVGHGASTVNNPHAAGLACGACGGQSGDANARVAAATLNDAQVRGALRARGLTIPADTLFVAALHDTTTDEVRVLDPEAIPASHRDALREIAGWLAEAGRGARLERAERLGIAPDARAHEKILARSRDWAQTRPEWGLAGCSSFVVAPRGRSAALDLGGEAFLHSYDWKRDPGFAVLETVMTAPLVVASWINLQYFASTVAPEVFGAGNKTLHNVVGGIGVLEGNGGDLRVGLPQQSIHDGTSLQHHPRRLHAIIEAPTEAMSRIIAKHEMLQQLLDNRWLFLLAMSAEDGITHRYEPGGRWVPVERAGGAELEATSAA